VLYGQLYICMQGEINIKSLLKFTKVSRFRADGFQAARCADPSASGYKRKGYYILAYVNLLRTKYCNIVCIGCRVNDFIKIFWQHWCVQGDTLEFTLLSAKFYAAIGNSHLPRQLKPWFWEDWMKDLIGWSLAQFITSKTGSCKNLTFFLFSFDWMQIFVHVFYALVRI
jgi:hypothetical protein